MLFWCWFPGGWVFVCSRALCVSPAKSPVRLRVSPTSATTVVHSQLWVSVSPLSQPLRHSPRSVAASPVPMVCCLTLVFLSGLYWSGGSDWPFFFNSLIVRAPCSLIFCHFRLFIDFRFVVILLLVVQGREGFLPTPPSWLEPLFFFLERNFNVRQKHWSLVASCQHPDWRPNYNLCMCPAQGSNPWLFALWDKVPTNWATPVRAGKGFSYRFPLGETKCFHWETLMEGFRVMAVTHNLTWEIVI